MLGEIVFDRLNTGRFQVWPQQRPQDAKPACVVYDVATERPIEGSAKIYNAVIETVCYGTTSAEADTIARDVQTLFHNYVGFSPDERLGPLWLEQSARGYDDTLDLWSVTLRWQGVTVERN